MKTISAYVIAFNEADKIEAAVSSVLWADEVIVCDSGSTDGTAEIAERLGARVVQIPFHGFGDLRNRAIAACGCDWIFSLDADERCTPETRDEILDLLAGDPPHDVYLVPRRNWMMGRWIRFGGWYPNYRQPQLFRRGALSYTLEPVHEGYTNHSPRGLGHLRQPIWQVPFRNFDEIIRKMNRYSTLGAVKLEREGATMWRALGHGIWAFIKHYFIKLGCLDGWAGFVIAFGNLEGSFWRHAKCRELTQDWSAPRQEPLVRPPRP
ncbi:MAG TPA: glycosyltransferase family 2 protein [Burkholderiales bacterium]|nr:glycosyltransferase family 2 protein [Burkholderiales bacterium]